MDRQWPYLGDDEVDEMKWSQYGASIIEGISRRFGFLDSWENGVLGAHQCPRPEAAPAGPGGMPACTCKHANRTTSCLLAVLQSLFARKVFCSELVQRNRVVE
jgi:hypothetical protein